MKKTKKKLTPEQKQKRLDKVGKVLVGIILLACVVLGFIKGCDNMNFDFSNMDAFTQLTNNPINVQSLITDNAINMDVDKVELAELCKSKGADYFTDTSDLDNNKWANNTTITDTITLTDRLFGTFVNLYYNFNRIKQVDIAVDSGNKYSIKIVEYIYLANMITNQEVKKIVPATCYTTSTYVVQVNVNHQIVVNSSTLTYNELNNDKSAVVTSTLKAAGVDIEKNSINKLLRVVEQFTTKTNTTVSFQGHNIIFNI